MNRYMLFALLIGPYSLHTMHFSYQQILDAVYKLTTTEKMRLEEYLSAEATENKLFQQLLDQFKNGNEKLVIQELSSQALPLYRILQVTPLRARMIEGKIANLLWFSREIAALDWFFEWDGQQHESSWPTVQQKALYLVGLVGQVERNYKRIANRQELNDIITILRSHLSLLSDQSPSVIKRALDNSAAKLTLIHDLYTLAH